MPSVLRTFREMLHDDAGGIALMLALSLIPLSIAAIGALDLQRAISTKSQLQDALDAAALAGAREPAADIDKIRDTAGLSFHQNLLNAPLTLSSGPVFNLKDNNRLVTGDASASVDTLLAQLVMGGKDIDVSAHSEVRRAGANLEVALVLDITGSMNQPATKIAALKAAASDLVDIVVEDQQTPFFSKIALVPYSAAVNLGGKADVVRGALKPGTSDKPGYASFSFKNMNGNIQEYAGSTCVTERTDDKHRYDDASYADAKVGYHYSSGRCLNEQVLPMTSDKALLKLRISNFTPEGSTAGHIGLAWGWYMVSPNFAGLWTGEGRALPYRTRDLVKAVVLMTDGEFNTVYANGVVSKDSLSGSGGSVEKIDKEADNDLPKPQALALCKNMKKEGVMVYTVGFQLTDPDAIEIMNTCATNPGHAYLPDSGVELRQAFQEIGHDIAKLHISR
jgi:Flp pilus assembly protein TadG